MTLPLHLVALMDQVDNVQIIVDNPRLPATSATDEYYQRLRTKLSVQHHTYFGFRELLHASFFQSPMHRRSKLRVGAKSSSLSASALSVPPQSLKHSLRLRHLLPPSTVAMLQQGGYKKHNNKHNRWSNSAAHSSQELKPPESPATLRPKMPTRSHSKECDASPSFPVRRPSWNTQPSGVMVDRKISQLIGDLQLLGNTSDGEEDDDDEEDEEEEVSSVLSLPVSNDHDHTFSSTTTSTLISQVIDNLQLYGNSNIDNEDSNSERSFTATAVLHQEDDDDSIVKEDEEFFAFPVRENSLEEDENESNEEDEDDEEEEEVSDNDDEDLLDYEEDAGSVYSCDSD
jgi:hypothetical protein